MLLDGVARCEFPAFSLYAFFCLVRIAMKIFSFAALRNKFFVYLAGRFTERKREQKKHRKNIF